MKQAHILVARMMWGPQNAKYPLPRVQEAPGQAIATTIGPWVARSSLVGKEVHMYVDAAEVSIHGGGMDG